MLLQIEVYPTFVYWKTNLATQESDTSECGIIYKHSIGTIEKLKNMAGDVELGGGVQLTYNFPKPSFTIYKEYLSEIKDGVNNVSYTGSAIDTDEKIIELFKQLA